MPQRVTREDNEVLLAHFSEEELRFAIFQIHPDKAPCPEGLNPTFFRRFWSLFGKDIFHACFHWLEVGYLQPLLFV